MGKKAELQLFILTELRYKLFILQEKLEVHKLFILTELGYKLFILREKLEVHKLYILQGKNLVCKFILTDLQMLLLVVRRRMAVARHLLSKNLETERSVRMNPSFLAT